MAIRAFVIGLLLAGLACTKKAASPTAPLTQEQMINQGRATYATACTACHSPDPARDGSLGPAVMGSSMVLLEHRIMTGDYPADYKPKRETRLMQKLPHLKDQISAIHAYLNSSGKP